jgi:2-polyprenyl-6-methoxyphenol hydroxylase-like FAD-dependent oxidoreductase
MQIVVVGGGVAGLGSALVLARQGHDVTVIERDDTPMPTSADDAFEWDRRGAPQVRHSHAFLARLTGLLRREHPDHHRLRARAR